MPADFADLVTQERNEAIERVSEYIDDPDAVLPITEARCLQHFSEQLEELWYKEGEQVTVRTAAQEALRMVYRRYIGSVLQYFGPGETEIVSESSAVEEVIGLLQEFMSSDQSKRQGIARENFVEAEYPFKWMIEKGFARLHKLQTDVSVNTLQELGMLVRICDYRILMTETATSAYDEWVYDFVEVIIGQIDSCGLLREPSTAMLQETIKSVIQAGTSQSYDWEILDGPRPFSIVGRLSVSDNEATRRSTTEYMAA